MWIGIPAISICNGTGFVPKCRGPVVKSPVYPAVLLACVQARSNSVKSSLRTTAYSAKMLFQAFPISCIVFMGAYKDSSSTRVQHIRQQAASR
jgi:hypothetical protein